MLHATTSEIYTRLRDRVAKLEAQPKRVSPTRLRSEMRSMRHELQEYAQAAWAEQRRHLETEHDLFRIADRARADLAAERERKGLDLAAVSVACQLTESFDPSGSFVYVLWGDDAERPLYVGQSTNVLARVGVHLRARLKRREVRRVVFLRCRHSVDMMTLERELIEAHRPPWNTRLVPSTTPMLSR